MSDNSWTYLHFYCTQLRQSTDTPLKVAPILTLTVNLLIKADNCKC